MNCADKVSVIRIRTHNCTHTKIKSKSNKKAYILTAIDHQGEKFVEFYYVFIQEFPRFDFIDNWECLFKRFLYDFSPPDVSNLFLGPVASSQGF